MVLASGVSIVSQVAGLVRALVVRGRVDELLGVRRADARPRGPRPRETPNFTSCAGDRGAVLEEQAVLEGEGPGLAAVGRLAGVGGEVGDDLRALGPGRRPRGQGSVDQPVEVVDAAVEAAGRIEVGEVRVLEDLHGAARAGRLRDGRPGGGRGRAVRHPQAAERQHGGTATARKRADLLMSPSLEWARMGVRWWTYAPERRVQRMRPRAWRSRLPQRKYGTRVAGCIGSAPGLPAAGRRRSARIELAAGAGATSAMSRRGRPRPASVRSASWTAAMLATADASADDTRSSTSAVHVLLLDAIDERSAGHRERAASRVEIGMRAVRPDRHRQVAAARSSPGARRRSTLIHPSTRSRRRPARRRRVTVASVAQPGTRRAIARRPVGARPR